MRKVISLLMAVVLVFGLAAPALAATIDQSASAETVTAGDQIVITVTLDETLENLIAFDYELYYDSTLFEPVSQTAGDISNIAAATDKNGNTYFSINKANLSGDGVFSVAAGTLATLTFQALEDVTEEQLASFRLEKETLWDDSWSAENIDDGNVATPELSVTVKPAAAATYTVTLPENPVGYTIAVSEGSVSPVEEGGSYSFTVTVDAENYEGTPVVKANGITIPSSDAGVYTISNITEDQTVTVEGLQETGVAADQVIYQHGSNGDQWPAGTPVYIGNVTLKGLAVTNVEWDATFENCTVTLHKKTAADASYNLAATAVVAGQPQMISMFSANINGSTYTGNSFTHSGTLENGQAEITFTANVQNYSGTKTIKLIVDGTSVEPEPENFTVSLTAGEGYTIAATEGSISPVTEGGSFSFTVMVNEGYEGTPVVKANGTELTAVDGIYTITGIDDDQTVTVEGIAQKIDTYKVTLTEGTGYRIVATEGSTSPVAEGGSFSFTVTVSNGYEGSPVVKVNGTELAAENGIYTIANIDADQTVTVEGITLKDNMYTVEASADVTASKGGEAVVSVKVTGNSNEEITAYNDYDVTVSYDPAALTYVSAAAAHDSAEITENNGTIRIVGHGESMQFSDPVATLTFTAAESGNHDVTVTSAKIDNSGNAITQNAPEAAVSDQTTVVRVGYPVVLPENFTGESTVLPGDDYTFTAPSEQYDITVTVGGESVTPSVEGLVYTISGVDGDVVITAVGKTYQVTKKGSNVTITGNDTACYGEDYSFTATADSGYAITGVSVQIGGAEATYTISNGSYIISGSSITGDVTITVSTQQQAADTTQITFSGVDAGEVVGGLIQYAANGQDFTFRLNGEEGYVYTVMLNGQELKSVDGVYTIPGDQINGTALTITITKAVDSFAPEVNVSQYIQLDGTVMWLITATEDDTVLSYGQGNTMFWSDKYNAYCWLEVSGESEDAVKQAAEAAIAAAAEDAAAAQVSYDYDVNQTGAVDINDAQLTYDMYQAKMYADFDTVTMDKFLEADVNGDKVVNVEDAAAVVAQILQ